MKEGSGSLENHSEYYALEKMYNPVIYVMMEY